MESALSISPATTLLTLTKTHLRRHFCTARPIQTHLSRRIFNGEFHSLHRFTSITTTSVKTLSTAIVRPCRGRLHCISSSAASFGSGGGGGIGGGGGGGGGGALNGGEKEKVVADVSEAETDVIILDVGGMSCGGCVASVKRILESQLNYVVNALLSLYIVIAFLVAVVLDNTVPGTRQEREVYVWSELML